MNAMDKTKKPMYAVMSSELLEAIVALVTFKLELELEFRGL